MSGVCVGGEEGGRRRGKRGDDGGLGARQRWVDWDGLTSSPSMKVRPRVSRRCFPIRDFPAPDGPIKIQRCFAGMAAPSDVSNGGGSISATCSARLLWDISRRRAVVEIIACKVNKVDIQNNVGADFPTLQNRRFAQMGSSWLYTTPARHQSLSLSRPRLRARRLCRSPETGNAAKEAGGMGKEGGKGQDGRERTYSVYTSPNPTQLNSTQLTTSSSPIQGPRWAVPLHACVHAQRTRASALGAAPWRRDDVASGRAWWRGAPSRANGRGRGGGARLCV